eukprot:2195774-Rhodomonas_salina.2
MTCLDVSENNIGAEGTARLFAVLAKCTAMSSLRASGNVVGAAGAAMLARAVGGWESLTCLDLLGGQMYYVSSRLRTRCPVSYAHAILFLCTRCLISYERCSFCYAHGVHCPALTQAAHRS